jgi:hypothetical protein
VVWIFGMNFHHKGPPAGGRFIKEITRDACPDVCARPNFRGEGLSLFYARREMAECIFFVSQQFCVQMFVLGAIRQVSAWLQRWLIHFLKVSCLNATKKIFTPKY